MSIDAIVEQLMKHAISHSYQRIMAISSIVVLIILLLLNFGLFPASFANQYMARAGFERNAQNLKVQVADATSQPSVGASVSITSANAAQLAIVATIALEPPYSMVNQIYWRQMQEIAARVGHSAIWLHRFDPQGDVSYLIEYGGGLIGKITVSPDGRLLAAPVNDSNRFKIQVVIWDTTTQKIVTRIDAFGAEFSTDGRFLVLNGNNALGIWNVSTSTVERVIADAGIFVDRTSIPPLSVSPNSETVASTDANGKLALWKVSTGQRIRDFKDQIGALRELWFSPDGTLLAARIDTRIQIWDVNTGDSRFVLDGATDDVLDTSFSPDGLLLAAVSDDSNVLLWDVNTGSLITTLTIADPDHAVVRSVAFSPDGTQLATGATPLTEDRKQLADPQLWLWAVQ